MYKLVALSDGQMTLIDEKHYLDVVASGPWHFQNRGYAYRTIKKAQRINGKKNQYLHHFIGAKKGILGEVDHKNLDKLDNTEENLRSSTRSQNQHNMGLRSDNSTGVKGVSFYDGKYYAKIWFKGKEIKLGSFTTLTEARSARHDATMKYHKEFGRTE